MMSPTVTRTELESADDIIREVGVVPVRRRQAGSFGSPMAQCEGKKAFESIALAETAAKRLPGRTVYRCRNCRLWHVGSVSKK